MENGLFQLPHDIVNSTVEWYQYPTNMQRWFFQLWALWKRNALPYIILLEKFTMIDIYIYFDESGMATVENSNLKTNNRMTKK